MNKIVKTSVVSILIFATSLFATNGSNLIAVGAKARGMGATGVGVAHGSESTLANASLITSVKSTEISFGGTIFMPDVESSLGSQSSESSSADLNVIPSVSIATKVNDNFYWGIGMWGTAGMGVDYRDVNNLGRSNYNMVTNLQLMQFALPLAYKVNSFSFSITPLLQYGSLDIDFNSAGNRHSGVSQDMKFGYNLGISYEVSDLTFGAIYKSQIDMQYDNQIASAGREFGLVLSDKLSTPSEIGLGLSYNVKEHTIAFDYKKIGYSSAKGYEDFKWEDQDVYAIGYEYASKGYSARVGYNYAKSPIKEQSPSPAGYAINALNLLGFPAIVESHITLGATFNVDEKMSIDIAYVHAVEKSESFVSADLGGVFDVKTKHSQKALTLGLNHAF